MTRVHRSAAAWFVRFYPRLEDSMKTLTCKELGGTCDQKLSANSWDEMVQVMTRHVMQEHPDVARSMEKMHRRDPREWARETKPRWDAAPEVR